MGYPGRIRKVRDEFIVSRTSDQVLSYRNSGTDIFLTSWGTTLNTLAALQKGIGDKVVKVQNMFNVVVVVTMMNPSLYNLHGRYLVGVAWYGFSQCNTLGTERPSLLYP